MALWFFLFCIRVGGVEEKLGLVKIIEIDKEIHDQNPAIKRKLCGFSKESKNPFRLFHSFRVKKGWKSVLNPPFSLLEVQFLPNIQCSSFPVTLHYFIYRAHFFTVVIWHWSYNLTRRLWISVLLTS